MGQCVVLLSSFVMPLLAPKMSYNSTRPLLSPEFCSRCSTGCRVISGDETLPLNILNEV